VWLLLGKPQISQKKNVHAIKIMKVKTLLRPSFIGVSNKLQRLFGVVCDHIGCAEERENVYQGGVYGRSNMRRSFSKKVFLAKILGYL
jgi:hypothetical protein